MAKEKKAKKGDKAKKASKAPKNDKKPKKLKSGVAKVAKNAGKIAAGMVVEEIVAATLVAAAAAMRDPKKARAIASAAGNELKSLTNEAAREGSALWKLALDIAGRSLDFVGNAREADEAAVPSRSSGGKKRSAR